MRVSGALQHSCKRGEPEAMNQKKRADGPGPKAATTGGTLEPRELSNSHAKSLARAVSLHLEGKAREALKELDNAVESGADAPELHSARGHLQYELEMYEEAV